MTDTITPQQVAANYAAFESAEAAWDNVSRAPLNQRETARLEDACVAALESLELVAAPMARLIATLAAENERLRGGG